MNLASYLSGFVPGDSQQEGSVDNSNNTQFVSSQKENSDNVHARTTGKSLTPETNGEILQMNEDRIDTNENTLAINGREDVDSSSLNNNYEVSRTKLPNVRLERLENPDNYLNVVSYCSVEQTVA